MGLQPGDLVSALVRDGVLYETDGLTPLKDGVFINGVLMRETSIAEAQTALGMSAATIA